jgi:tetratricopeptide (TPR) repeat protein
MGDGIMALFGAPLALEDHAIRACYAALRMQAEVKGYAREALRTVGLPIAIRTGLNSGEVVVGAIDSDLHMDYTAIGQTVHLASRMEAMAAPGSILMTAETLRQAEGYVVEKPLGPVPVKGLDSPLEVYELTGAATVRSRLHATAARGLTRFVGRDSEIEYLRRGLERAGRGHGQVLAVVGDAGVGKSRLFWEFTHSHRTQGWLIVESSSVSYGKATSYLPVIELLKGYFQIETGDDVRNIRERVTGKLLSLDRALEPSLPALLWLLEVPVEDEQWDRLDPPQRRQRVLDGIKRLLLRESQVQPLLVLFEDLHWIDAETQALLDSLVESLPSARIMLLVNYRPEYQHKWSGKSYYQQIQVDPLQKESADQLLVAILGSDPGLDELKALLVERTEGNPFFLEESVRTLVETKALEGDRGSYRLARATNQIDIPATAQSIVAARIDRVPPEDKQLLQAASVIGKDVAFTLLQAIAQTKDEGLKEALSRLQAAEFLYESRLFPDVEYTFRHALTYEVAYRSLLQDRRRALHTEVMRAIETLAGDQANEIERLADHSFRGEVWQKAVPYLRQAGTKALARSAYRDAAAYFEKALTALDRLPKTSSAHELALDLRFELRNALWPLGEFERLLKILREAEVIARELGDNKRRGWVSLYLGANLWITGHPAEARSAVEETLAIGEAIQDLPLRVAARFYLGTTHAISGEYRLSKEPLFEITQLLAGDRRADRCGLPFYPSVLARSWLVWSMGELGEFEEGIAIGEEAMRLAEALNHPYSLAHLCYDLGYLYIVQEKLDSALPLLERGYALAREWHLTFLWPLVSWFLGHSYVLSGRTAEGMSLLEGAQSAFRSLGSGAFQPFALIHLGEAYLKVGRQDDAINAAREALRFSRERGQRGYEAYALRLLGEIASVPGAATVAEAATCYTEAMALATELGMRPLVARCRVRAVS